MNSCITHARLVLASGSPRRRQLLEQFGLGIQVVPSGIDEDRIAKSGPEHYVESLASAKALAVSGKLPDAWVIGADTIVVADGQILGKPAGRRQARRMLQKLSGRTHEVMTGTALCCGEKDLCATRTVTTEVTFKSLSAAEIDWYLSTGEPYDKAGGYGIQGKGAFLVKRIAGSYTNVVGLPVCETIEMLIENGVLQFNPKTPDRQQPNGELVQWKTI